MRAYSRLTHNIIVHNMKVENIMFIMIKKGNAINVTNTPTNKNLNKYTSIKFIIRAQDFPKNPSSGLFSNCYRLSDIPFSTWRNPDITLILSPTSLT